jgi:hypothetical protein
MLPILHEGEVNEDVGRLDRAWKAEPTFAYLTEKGGVSDEWVREILGALPEPYRSGHFALLTSGTTGRAKLVFGVKERAEKLARALHELQESEPVRETIVTPATFWDPFAIQLDTAAGLASDINDAGRAVGRASIGSTDRGRL